MNELDSWNAHQRDLVVTIERTVQFLLASLPWISFDRSALFKGLVESAATSLLLTEVIARLAPGSQPFQFPASVLDALCAVVSIGHLDGVKHLLDIGVDPCSRSRTFGRPLSIAARLGLSSLVGHLLARTGEHDEEAIRCVLKEASSAGQEQSVKMILQMAKPPTFRYGEAMLGAVHRRHISIIRILLSFRPSHIELHAEQGTKQTAFWIKVLRYIIRADSIELRNAVLELWYTIDYELFDVLLEDACQYGSIDSVRFLLNLDSHVVSTSAIFHAARECKQDIQDLLLAQNFYRNTCAYADALAGASSGHTSQIDSSLLSRMVSDLSAADSAKPVEARLDFHAIIDRFLDSVTSREDISASLPVESCLTVVRHSTVPEYPGLLGSLLGTPSADEKALCQAVRIGDLDSMRRGLRMFLSQGPESALHNAFWLAAEYNRPGMLLYIGRYVKPVYWARKDLLSYSTAVLQTLLDLGWDINEPFTRISPPLLAYVFCLQLRDLPLTSYSRHTVHEELLSAWALRHGADSNAGCDWDLTPLSFAVEHGPLSSIELLLNWGGNIHRGQLLHFAVRRKSEPLRILDMLLSLGAEIDVIQYEKDATAWAEKKLLGMGTPLHLATELDKPDIVEYLLRKGANAMRQNSLGKTALDLARERQHCRIARILQAHSKF